MGVSQTKEKDFESLIEKTLVGTSLEERNGLALNIDDQRPNANQYYYGAPNHFKRYLAIDTHRLWSFLYKTQKDALDGYVYKDKVKEDVLKRINDVIATKGILEVLHHGIEVKNINLKLFYTLPTATEGETSWDKYNSNEFSVTRQVKYSLNNENSIDMVIFVNGLPLFTIELKNPWTNQSARIEGQNQYKYDRSNKDTIFNFGRCIAHFTLDQNEVFFTTKLDGDNTVFMPFNLGLPNGQGAGNPINEHGYKTSYFWNEILSKDVVSDLITNYVVFEYGDKKGACSLKDAKKLIFPRLHQLQVVQKLTKDVAEHGVGKTYLIQHSAGSGKSNSLTWLAFKLIGLCPSNEQANRTHGLTEKIFNTVIVVTDRRILDQQINNNFKAFGKSPSLIAHANKAHDLQQYMQGNVRIIITTIQKFPIIYQDVADLSDKNFAIIIDEAHSSQSGSSAEKLNAALQNKNANATQESGEINLDDTDSLLEKYCSSQQMSKNCSYFAFTATPKKETLERFGTQSPDGSFHPFHLYSMKQAIEEGFILDVLTNYSTFQSYYELINTSNDNPTFDVKKAQKALKHMVETNNEAIKVKAEQMLIHFNTKVVNRLKGKAKAMVATQNIECAIRYYFALKNLIAENNYNFKIAIAFTGEKEVDGITYSEAMLNGCNEAQTPAMFAGDDYRIMVVANKYLTGFDQPKLCAMYVDKPLAGVLAVQALSRLNRSAPDLGKSSSNLFVLDFYNTVEDIKKAFDPFYTASYLDEPTNVDILFDLKNTLLAFGVFTQEEVDSFASKYITGTDAQESSVEITQAAHRFENELDFDEVTYNDFILKCRQFYRIYKRIVAIIPYTLKDCQKLFFFLHFLLKLIKLKTNSTSIQGLLDNVDLNSYGLRCENLNTHIRLDAEENELNNSQTSMVEAKEQEEELDTLDNIIKKFNEANFDGWETTPETQKVIIIKLRQEIINSNIYKSLIVNNQDTREANNKFNELVQKLVRVLKNNDDDFNALYIKYMQNNEFKDNFNYLMQSIVKLNQEAPLIDGLIDDPLAATRNDREGLYKTF